MKYRPTVWRAVETPNRSTVAYLFLTLIQICICITSLTSKLTNKIWSKNVQEMILYPIFRSQTQHLKHEDYCHDCGMLF